MNLNPNSMQYQYYIPCKSNSVQIKQHANLIKCKSNAIKIKELVDMNDNELAVIRKLSSNPDIQNSRKALIFRQDAGFARQDSKGSV